MCNDTQPQRNSQLASVRILLANGANVNEPCTTPKNSLKIYFNTLAGVSTNFHDYTANAHFAPVAHIVEMLLDADGENVILTKDAEGKTGYDYADQNYKNARNNKKIYFETVWRRVMNTIKAWQETRACKDFVAQECAKGLHWSHVTPKQFNVTLVPDFDKFLRQSQYQVSQSSDVNAHPNPRKVLLTYLKNHSVLLPKTANKAGTASVVQFVLDRGYLPATETVQISKALSNGSARAVGGRPDNKRQRRGTDGGFSGAGASASGSNHSQSLCDPWRALRLA